MNIISKLWNSLTKKVKEFTSSISNKKVKELLKSKKQLSQKDFTPGNLLFIAYNAKDKTQIFDRTPLVLVLRRGSKYTLGLNFHWLPVQLRVKLIKIIFSMNSKNIKNNKPLQFNYADLKPHMGRLGFAPVVRLYINNRISNLGVVIPPENLISAARLKAESFTNGKHSSEQLYKKAQRK